MATTVNHGGHIRASAAEDRVLVEHPVYSPLRRPLIEGEKTHADVTRDICRLLEKRPGRGLGRRFLCSLEGDS